MRSLRLARRGRSPGVAALALALSGCGIIEAPPPVACPRVAIVAEAAEVTGFRPGGGRDVVDVRYFAEFRDVQWSCDYDKNTLEVDLTLVVVARSGPTSQAQAADLRYFVALAERGGRLVAKKTFASQVALASQGGTGAVSEEIEQRIPLKAGQSGTDFEILIGFQLTREQLEYNRGRSAP